MNRKGILICADDFGLHPDVDEAILDLGNRGRICVTSVLVDAAIQHGEQVLRLRASEIETGLHLNLTERVGTLSSQNVKPLRALIAAAYFRTLSTDWLHDAIDRQLNHYESLFGEPPSYVDGHQHVHQLPVVRDVLLQVLEQRYSDSKPWLRSTRSLPGMWRGSVRDWLKAQVIESLGARAFTRKAHLLGFDLNHGFAGVYDFTRTGQPFARLMQNWLDYCQNGSLIMTHPSKSVLRGDPVGQARLQEYEVLGSDVFAQWLRQRGLHIARRADQVLKSSSSRP